VPYRGDALALNDTISGHVQATFSTAAASLEYVTATIALAKTQI
jgi:tripartite-type tricarboxylate transporter receptor subunit TctC